MGPAASEAARGQMDRAVQDLKMEANVAKSAVDGELQRVDRFVQELGSKLAHQEAQLLRLSDLEHQRLGGYKRSSGWG